MPRKLASAASTSDSMSTPPPKKKKGGFFGCRSKHALDSLPRNARGDNAAINRLQARNVFQHGANPSDSTSSTAAVTPLTEEKGLQKLAELNATHTTLPPPTPQPAPVKPPYAQEVPEGEHADSTDGQQQHHNDQENEKEEARDMFLDEALVPVYDRPTTPGAARSLSVTSKAGRIKRSLSLKRSGSTASANLIARAPPVGSADFADLPASSSSSSDLTEKEGSGLGDMASIRKARGRHQIGAHRPLVSDVSEDEYLAFDNDVPIPPARLQATDSPQQTPVKKHALVLSMPDSDSMRAVAAALEGSADSVRFQPGPAVGTPKLEPPSPASDAYSAEIQSQLRREASEDTVTDLPSSAPAARRDFWDTVAESEDSFGPGRTIPFQYVTNLARPVSIASLRSLACPSTPPRTSSSRPTSPDGGATYHGLRSTRSFSASPLKGQATFNGFPRTFFPNVTSTLKHSPSVASNASRRKPVPEAIPALEFEHVHVERHQRRLQREHHHDEAEDDVEHQLGGAHTRTHTCSNCGVVEEQRDFAAFVAKGKASRRTSVKQQTIKTTAAGSLRKSKSAPKQDTVGEATLKRWGLAEAFKSAQAEASSSAAKGENVVMTVSKPKKMVPGPGGGYITDTANMRWCSALDEIKKALAVDAEHERGPSEEEAEEDKVNRETQSALAQADAVLARLGVET